MSERPSVCIDCGAALAPGYPSMLCPRCLWSGDISEPENSAAPVPAGMAAMRVPGHDVIEEIARGGMGVVYRARERETQRTVALKMLRPRLADEEGMRERFRMEASAVAALEHPSILPVYRVDEADDMPFFTMKLAAGGTLADRRESLRGRWREIATMLVTLADAVQYHHQHGVLHRDLKPQNVLFDDAGKVYLTDFGLVKLIDAVSELTGSQSFIGTPHYSAPEVAGANAGAATVTSDIWSLGAMLYELLSGHLPFHAEGVAALLRKIVEDPAPPLPPEVPRDLAVICLKCLAKSESGRYQNAAALGEDLQRWLDGRPILARPMSRTEKFRNWVRRNPALAGVSAALIAACIVAAGALVRESRASRAAQAVSEENARASRRQEAVALVAEARSKRMSGSFVDRDSGLAAARKSWGMVPTAEARDEVLSLLALPGVAVAGTPVANGSFRGWNARADDNLLRYVIMVKEGCSVRDMKTRKQISLVPDLPVQRVGAGYPPGPLSPSGRLLALRKDGKLTVWDVERRAVVLNLPALWGANTFSADSRFFLAGPSRGAPVKPHLCDLGVVPPAIRLFPDLPPNWTSHAISPDGTHFVIGGASESGLRLIRSGDFSVAMDYHYPADYTVRTVLWSADSGFFLTCSHTGHIGCWHPDKPDPVWMLPAHAGDAYTPALFNENTGLATAGADGLLQFWNLITHQPAGTLPLRSVALQASRDGRRIFADDPDRRNRPLLECTMPVTASLVQLPAGRASNVYAPGHPWIEGLKGEAGFVLTGGYDLHVTDAGGTRILSSQISRQNEAFALDETGQRIFRRTGGELNVLSWQRQKPAIDQPTAAGILTESNKVLRRMGFSRTFLVPAPEVPFRIAVAGGTPVAFDPVSRRLLCGGAGGFEIWQFPVSGLEASRVPLPASPAAGLPLKAGAWSPGGKFFACSCFRKAEGKTPAVRGTWIFDAATGQVVSTPLPGETALSLAFLPGESRLLASTAQAVVSIDIASGRVEWSVPHERPAEFPPCLAVAAGGQLAAATLTKESITLLDPVTGAIRCRLTHPVTRTVAAVAFNKSGTRLAAVAGNYVQTWKIDVIESVLRREGMDRPTP